MNILIVDDQISVLDAITGNIDFEALGIRGVFTATGSEMAKDIMSGNEIHILLSDIEMPGENGLELNRFTRDNYPNMVRILLTTHESFKYAQESLKLGCFDYIVQPAPMEEITECLERAISKIVLSETTGGEDNNELISNIILNLYSDNPANKKNAIESLNRRGHAINPDSVVRCIVINAPEYDPDTKEYISDREVFNTLITCTREYFGSIDIRSLTCINRFKHFVVLLYSDEDSLSEIIPEVFTDFQASLSALINPRIACYVSNTDTLNNVRKIIYETHLVFANNLSKAPGVYFAGNDTESLNPGSLSENIDLWQRLLFNGSFERLYDGILVFLDFNSSIYSRDFNGLRQFHQAFTQMIFKYAFKQNINIMDIFTEDYSYNSYMNCFSDYTHLREGVLFLLKQFKANCESEESVSDIDKAIEYIHNNIAQNISVKEVASYVHLNSEYFSKLFKKETGENVKNYILKAKVDAAKSMLADPNIPIGVVALELGYSNFSHFTQVFKKHENITPTEYRAKYKSPRRTGNEHNEV